MLAWGWALALFASTCPEPLERVEDPRVQAAQWAALGRQHALDEDWEVAAACFSRARQADPDAEEWALEWAAALVAQDRLQEARTVLGRASTGAERDELNALLALRLEDETTAREAGGRAATWDGRMLATLAGSPDAISELARDLDASGRRGWVSAALGLLAASKGRLDDARLLMKKAERAAERERLFDLREGVRTYQRRLAEQRKGPLVGAFGRTTAGVASNPLFQPSSDPASAGVFTELRAGFRLGGLVGRVGAHADFAAQQRLYLNDRSELRIADVTGLEAAGRLDIPIGKDPTAAALLLDLRFTGGWADDLRQGLGTVLEAGPALRFRVASRAHLSLGFYGVRMDLEPNFGGVDDGAPSDDRDLLGQRARIGLDWAQGSSRATVEMLFTAEQADGTEFDAIGGGGGARVAVGVARNVDVDLDVSAWFRDFGPRDVPGPLGDAETRSEVRARFGAGVRWWWMPGWALRVHNLFLTNSAVGGAAYNTNVTAGSVEAVW